MYRFRRFIFIPRDYSRPRRVYKVWVDKGTLLKTTLKGNMMKLRTTRLGTLALTLVAPMIAFAAPVIQTTETAAEAILGRCR